MRTTGQVWGEQSGFWLTCYIFTQCSQSPPKKNGKACKMYCLQSRKFVARWPTVLCVPPSHVDMERGSVYLTHARSGVQLCLLQPFTVHNSEERLVSLHPFYAPDISLQQHPTVVSRAFSFYGLFNVPVLQAVNQSNYGSKKGYLGPDRSRHIFLRTK